MSIIGAAIFPHPPVILPEIGRGREREIQATIDACRSAARRVAELEPDVLVVSSPHTVMYADYFHISPGRDASGDMSDFGVPHVKLHAEYDERFREELIRLAESEGLWAGVLGERSAGLDHGVFIPLHFLREAGVDCPIVRIGLSGFSPVEHYKLGMCAARAANALGRRAVFIASGDLSHKLKDDGPYGFSPEGPDFDSQVTAAMFSADFLRLLTFDPSFCEKAAECGLRSFQIMAGALDGASVSSELLSHEGPFGVGYAVAVFTVTGDDGERRFLLKYEQDEKKRLDEKRAAESPWVRLARLSLETYVQTGTRLCSLPDGLPSALTENASGVFVSLQLRGKLRGCIGTTSPVTPSVAEEIIQNAVSAGTEDPRFHPVTADELHLLEYKVDVLGQAEPVSSPEELDVKRYGVIVSCGGRRGLLLPDLDGVDTVGQQIDIARQKGGIGPNEPYTLERFEVVRHT